MKLEAACVKHRVRVLAYVLAVWSCETLQGVKGRLHAALREAIHISEALSSKATRQDALAQAYQALVCVRARRAAGQKRLGLALAAWLSVGELGPKRATCKVSWSACGGPRHSARLLPPGGTVL